MFHGTTIDELLEIVERAEEQAHVFLAKSEDDSHIMYPGFLAEMTKTNQEWLGVA